MGSFSLNFIDALVAIGIPRDRAQSLSELLERGIDERYSLHGQVLATKRDLTELELKMAQMELALRADLSQTKISISQLELNLGTMISACNERIAELGSVTHQRIAESKSDVIKWMLGAMIALAGVLIAAMRLTA